MGFLDDVISHKKEEIKNLKGKFHFIKEALNDAPSPLDPNSFIDEEGINIIAEIKKRSPSAGDIKRVDVKKQAKIYEEAGAFAISVLTDERYFGGSLEDLKDVKDTVRIPVLRKDFIIDEIQIYESRIHGADLVLLIVRILEKERLKDFINLSRELGMTPLVEIFSEGEAEIALNAGAEYIGINNRDLDTLKIDLSLSERLIPELKKLGVKRIVVESGIEKTDDIKRFYKMGVNIFLIGTSLMKSEDPFHKIKELKSCIEM